MRILLISAHFPPYAPAAATRAPKLAQHWLRAGHEVRVLGALREKLPPILSPGIPEDLIRYVEMRDVNEIPGEVLGRLRGGGKTVTHAHRSPSGARDAEPASPAKKSSLNRKFWWFYKQITNIPDQHAGWIKPAIADGEAMLEAWPANLIYATAPPHSALVAADALSRRSGIPWIAEYRDAWVTNGYYDGAWFRKPFEHRLEKRVIASASAIVAVSETTAETLSRFHDKRAIAAMNGFDPDDFATEPVSPLAEGRLTILYAGSIYPGKRDPSALFAALDMLGPLKHEIEIHFYIPQPALVRQLVVEHSVEDHVRIHAPVPRDEILRLERAADVLLLLRWDDPREQGVIAGKLFEYIGAERPILSIGGTSGEAVDIIRRENLGRVSNDPGEISEILRNWVTRKKAGEALVETVGHDPKRYTYARQFAKIDALIGDVLGG